MGKTARTSLKWLVSLVMVITFLLPISCSYNSGYFPSGTQLTFEHYPIQDYYYRSESAALIWVIASLQQYERPTGIEWQPPLNQPDKATEPPQEIIEFDFSKNILIFVFNGFRGGYQYPMKTKGLWQQEDTINVSVDFDDLGAGSTSIPINSSQYNALKVSKDSMTQFGEITFIIFNETGKERATTTCEILQ